MRGMQGRIWKGTSECRLMDTRATELSFTKWTIDLAVQNALR